MTNKKIETDNSIPEPDPSWDYYLTYHTLIKGKFKLDKLIKEVSQFEEASVTQDEYIAEQLSKVLATLNSVLPKIDVE
jgi:hypothetical protein